MPPMTSKLSLLHLDSSAALLVGIGMLVLAGYLRELYGMSGGLYSTIALANIGYGLYSLSLVLRSRRSRSAILALVVANGTWAVLCAAGVIVLAITEQASVFGIAHVVAEGVFVGGLAVAEWRSRERLFESSE